MIVTTTRLFITTIVRQAAPIGLVSMDARKKPMPFDDCMIESCNDEYIICGLIEGELENQAFCDVWLSTLRLGRVIPFDLAAVVVFFCWHPPQLVRWRAVVVLCPQVDVLFWWWWRYCTGVSQTVRAPDSPTAICVSIHSSQLSVRIYPTFLTIRFIVRMR